MVRTAVQKLILLPRFTSFAGEGTFHTVPLNVREFASVNVTFTEVGHLGSTGPAVTVKLQESPDLTIWTDIGSALSDATTESRDFKFEWIRLEVGISGGDPGITCWAVGNFIPREVSS